MSGIYGSIHTHFEDSFDAVTDLHLAVRSFLTQHAVSVAATGHGIMTEYENVRDIIAEAGLWADEAEKALTELGIDLSRIQPEKRDGKETGRYIVPDSEVSETEVRNFLLNSHIFGHMKEDDVTADNAETVLQAVARIRSFRIVPGAEVYFEDNRKHMVLIAKDEEGYRQLSRIISESNGKIIKDKPIVTMDILKDNVRGGHIIATSACAGGVFGQEIFSYYGNMEKIKKSEDHLRSVGYFEALQLEKEYITEPEAAYRNAEKVTVAMITEQSRKVRKLEKENAPEQDRQAAADYLEHLRELSEIHNKLDENRKEKQREYASVTIEADGQEVTAESVLKKYRREWNTYTRLREEAEAETESSFLDRQRKENISLYLEFANIFGRDNFYFEIQNHGIPQEKEVYNQIVRLAYETGTMDKIIASNDIHLCVSGDDRDMLEREVIRRNIARLGRYGNYEYGNIDVAAKYKPPAEDDGEYYIKNDDELRNTLLKIIASPSKSIPVGDIVETAVDNIRNVLSECSVNPDKSKKHYPTFCPDENEEFDRLVEEGANRIFPEGLSAEYRERLDKEKAVIRQLGYAGYHLIVQDYLAYGRLLGFLTEEQIESAPLDLEELKDYMDDLKARGKINGIGLGIGPGRGSAAGSLCCYFLGITNIDPIKYGLLFERFLNTERVSMPDIDADFKTDIRDKVYKYCMKKYGADNVSKITTKTYLALKGAVRKAGQYYLAKEAAENTDKEVVKSIKLSINAAVDTLIGWIDECKDMTDAEILNSLRERSDKKNREDRSVDYNMENILYYTDIIQGMFTVTGQHAAGVIISRDPIKDIVPVMWSQKCASYQIQCEMARAEEYGLLKMDFLGLQNLDICTQIAQSPQYGDPVYKFQTPAGIREILADERIYKEIYSAGYVQGVFQFESDGMKKLLMRFKPECFEDIILLVAAYRPGPMAFLDEMIDMKNWIRAGKQGKEPEHSITVKNEALDKILAPTYGCPIYQEQIMQIFQDMAGYSLGGADLVRRAMSKKNEEKLLYEKKAFIYGDEERNIPGCIKKQGITEKEADRLFEQMMPFARYGFNKSHAACYAQISVYTAYLKLYKTPDFFRVSMDAMKDIKSLEPYYREAEEHNIRILPPDLDSGNGFTVINEKELKRGFASILGMGNIPEIECKSDCAETFIERNPDIPLKNIITLANLGLFKTSWEAVTEEEEQDYKDYIASGDSIQYLMDFVDKYGKDIRTRQETGKTAQKLDADREIFYKAAADYKKDKKNVLTVEYRKEKKSPDYLLGSFACNVISAEERIKCHETLLSRTGDPATARSFSLLENASGFVRNIPAVVLSVTDKTTKSGRQMQIITLMDKDKNEVSCVSYPSEKTARLKQGDCMNFSIPGSEDERRYKGVWMSKLPNKPYIRTGVSVSCTGNTVENFRNFKTRETAACKMLPETAPVSETDGEQNMEAEEAEERE